MNRVVLLVVTFFALSGCAVIHKMDEISDRHQAEALNAWIGRTKEELRNARRAPTVIVPTADGGEIWTYIDTFSGEQFGQPWTTTSSTSFTISADGKVTAWRKA